MLKKFLSSITGDQDLCSSDRVVLVAPEKKESKVKPVKEYRVLNGEKIEGRCGK